MIDRDDGFMAEQRPSRYFQSEPWPHEEPAIAHVSGSVLDVGCGAGRHLLWMERHVIEAVGVDSSKHAIEVCRPRGCKKAFEIDVLSEPYEGTLAQAETITLFGNNIGIGATFAGACTLFEKLKDFAAPGGRVIVTGIDVAATKNPVHLAYHERNVAVGHRRGEIKMRFEYMGQIGPWIEWYHPEPSELDEIAALSGWEINQLEILETGFFWAILRHKK